LTGHLWITVNKLVQTNVFLLLLAYSTPNPLSPPSYHSTLLLS
jgi:hypothetical protein